MSVNFTRGSKVVSLVCDNIDTSLILADTMFYRMFVFTNNNTFLSAIINMNSQCANN